MPVPEVETHAQLPAVSDMESFESAFSKQIKNTTLFESVLELFLLVISLPASCSSQTGKVGNIWGNPCSPPSSEASNTEYGSNGAVQLCFVVEWDSASALLAPTSCPRRPRARVSPLQAEQRFRQPPSVAPPPWTSTTTFDSFPKRLLSLKKRFGSAVCFGPSCRTCQSL